MEGLGYLIAGGVLVLVGVLMGYLITYSVQQPAKKDDND